MRPSTLFVFMYLTLATTIAVSGMYGRTIVPLEEMLRLGLTSTFTTGGPDKFYRSLAAFQHIVAILAVYAVFLRANRTVSLGDRRAFWLWITFMIFAAVEVFTSVRGFGLAPMTHLKILLPVLVATACCLTTTITYSTLYACYQWVSRIMSAVLIVMLFIATRWIAAPDYFDTFLPGVPLRLHGFTHANGLAWMLGIYWLLSKPENYVEKRKLLGLFLDGLTGVCFVMTQSKTMYLLVVAGLVFRALLPWFLSCTSLLRLGIISVCSSVAFALIYAKETILTKASDLTSIDISKLETLTNRTLIWEAALHDWQAKPWLGWGAASWNDQMGAFSIGNWIAPYAHNQFVQILWDAGILGLAAFCVHIIAMSILAWNSRPAIRPGLLAFVVVFVVRGISEVPVMLFSSHPLNLFTYVSVLAMLCAGNRNNEVPVSDGIPLHGRKDLNNDEFSDWSERGLMTIPDRVH